MEYFQVEVCGSTVKVGENPRLIVNTETKENLLEYDGFIYEYGSRFCCCNLLWQQSL